GFSAGRVGALWMLAGIGSLGATAAIERLNQRLGFGPTMLAGMLGTGVGWLLLATASGGELAASALFGLGLFVLDFSGMVFFINYLTLRQAVTPDQLLGRVTATMICLTVATAPFGGLRDYATVGRDVLDQKFHLGRENFAIGEDQVLRLVRHIRCVKKLQSRFFRHAVALDSVAGTARRDHVHPRVSAAARYRPDMVPRQPQKAEPPSAIRADMAVAAKQLAVVDRRHLIEA